MIKPILFCRLAIALLSLAALLPQAMPVEAKSSVLQWNLLDTPGSLPQKHDMARSTEINHFVIGSDGITMYAVDIPNANTATGGKALYKSLDGGKSWNDEPGKYLYQSMSSAEIINFRIWNIAVSPDNSNFIAAVTNSTTVTPGNVWLSRDGGDNWVNTKLNVTNPISTIDITSDTINHYIAVGTRTGTGLGTLYTFKTEGTGTWKVNGITADILILKWSPNFNSDQSIAIVCSTTIGSYINIGIYDSAVNTTNWDLIYGSLPPEITTGSTGSSATAGQIIGADLELPEDFSGQSPSFRRLFISIDASIANSGIYRIDDTTAHWLMPSTAIKRIASIAYYGTYASGKLLAGEVLGDSSKATAMTWFTDAPATCPNTCWYPAIKPATGAAGTESCSGQRYCNTQVEWAPDGENSFAATASSATLISGSNWYIPFLTGKELDESAFSQSKNNGETWNQLSLIDTKIDYFTDLAPAAKVNVMYLSSSNNNTGCAGFDSVWKSTGIITQPNWERVLCKPVLGQTVPVGQTNTSILQIPGDSPDGQNIFYASTGTSSLLWSPDYGNYWITLNTNLTIQDIAAEDKNTLYILDHTGTVQKLGFNGKSWYSIFSKPTEMASAYSIATAYTATTPDNERGTVIIGGTGNNAADIVYSTNGGKTFDTVKPQLPTIGNTMVIASSSFRSDGGILAINSGGMYNYSIFSGDQKWEEWWGGASWPSPVTGLAISRNYGFYFNTPASSWSSATPYVRWSSAKSGLNSAVSLGNQDYPDRKIKICGGMESNEPITAFILDQRNYNYPTGGIWYYVDTLAWTGPLPTSPVSQSPVNFDPVSGRNGQIHLSWKPSSLSRGYRIQIAKDGDFRLLIADIGSKWGGPFYTPYNADIPALIIPSGGGEIKDNNNNKWQIPSLEAGHLYYWRVKVQNVFTGDAITSPWSWRESFTIKNGFKVASPYYGLQLIQPANGYINLQSLSPCFSWTPYKNTDTYLFQLSEQADMTRPLISVEVPNTAYQYNGVLKADTGYFWRVCAVKPYPSDWSPVGTFSTKVEKPIVTTTKIETIPIYVWIIIGIGTILAIVLLTLIVQKK